MEDPDFEETKPSISVIIIDEEEIDVASIDAKNLCTKCGINFQTRIEAIDHLVEHHDSLQEMDAEKVVQEFYKCFFCSAKTKQKSDLRTHLIQNHLVSNPKLECPICEEELKKGEFGIHTLKNHNYCFECNEFLDGSQKLVGHILAFHGDAKNEIKCPKCSFVTKNHGIFRNHTLSSHSKEAEKDFYKCQICEESYKDLQEFQRHDKNLHVLYNGNRCDFCSSDFNSRKSLSKHLFEVHKKCLDCKKRCDSVGKPHMNCKNLCISPSKLCNFCKMPVKNLVLHCLESHENCIFCDLKFKSRMEMMSHVASAHFTEKPNYFTCFFCDKNVKYQRDLVPHLKKDHFPKTLASPEASAFLNSLELGQEKPKESNFVGLRTFNSIFMCEFCPIEGVSTKNGLEELKQHYFRDHNFCYMDKCQKRYKTQQEFSKHLKEDHTKRFPCKNCKFETWDETILQEHIKTSHGSNKCNICGLLFHKPLILYTHYNTAHFKCTVYGCGTKFDTENEYSKHMLEKHEKGLKCARCSLKFPTANLLQNHVKKVHEPSKIKGENKMLKCRYCPDYVVGTQSLKMHYMSEHFLCDEKKCGRMALNVKDLVAHIAKDHKRILKCKHCDFIDLDVKALQLHVEKCGRKKRNEDCQVQKQILNTRNSCYFGECKRPFGSKDELILHLQSDHGLNLTCKECDFKALYSDAFLEHMKSHEEEKEEDEVVIEVYEEENHYECILPD